MANPLDKRPLDERFDLTYVSRRTWPKNVYHWLSIAAMLLVLAVIALLTYTDDRRLYKSGELTDAHLMFGHKCHQCHRPDPNRIVYWLPITDAACLSCHAGEAHYPTRSSKHVSLAWVADRHGPVLMDTDCASCHIEHLGRNNDLNRVSDQLCVRCHNNLPLHRKATTAVSHQLHAGVARVYPPTDGPMGDLIDGFNHESPTKAHPQFRVVAGDRIDTTLLGFEHEVHMDPQTPQMQQQLEKWVADLMQRGIDEAQIPVVELAAQDGGTPSQSLTCTACHVTDAAGQYMLPIAFEQHCVQCHPLGRLGGEPVPHGAAVKPFLTNLVTAKLLQRKASAAQRAAPAPSTTKSRGPRPGPKRKKPAKPKPGPRPESQAHPPFGGTPHLAAHLASQLVAAAHTARPRPGPRGRSTARKPSGPSKPDPLRRELQSQLIKLTRQLTEKSCSRCHVQLIDVKKARSTRSAAAATMDWDHIDWDAVDWDNIDYSKIHWNSIRWDKVEWSKIEWSKIRWSKVDWSAVDRSKVDFSGIDPAQLDWTEVTWQTVHASDWTIVDPKIPDRWLPRSFFNHAAHRFLACTQCHTLAGPPADGSRPARQYVGQDDPNTMTSRLRATGSTRDIMMPGIDACRRCHNRQRSVRSDCVMCHTYHEPSIGTSEGGARFKEPLPEPLKIEELLSAVE